jgi:hypothetical protein
MHWAGFLVMGANTCLPSGGLHVNHGPEAAAEVIINCTI